MKAFTILSLATSLVAASRTGSLADNKPTVNINIRHLEIQKSLTNGQEILNFVTFVVNEGSGPASTCTAYSPDFKPRSNANGVYQCSDVAHKFSFSVYPSTKPDHIQLHFFDAGHPDGLSDIPLACTPVAGSQTVHRCSQFQELTIVV
ncbi:hypothetical protein E4U54_004232 [Claviceps lovelessii]|nr:hypothetical protein E4U54_004232 [Claviceps lovelessii]